MSNLVLIFVCLVLGIFIKRTGRFPQTTPQSLNSFIIFISLPSLILTQVPKLFLSATWSWALVVPVSMAWLLFGGSWLMLRWLGKRRGWSPARTGALILTAGLGNTSFVGFPILEAMLGTEAIPWAVLVDQLGSFLVLATLGIFVATSYGRPRDGIARSPLRQVVTFPPFLALLTSLGLGLIGIPLETTMETVLSRLASTLVPLALVGVGFQLKVSPAILRRYGRPLAIGLSYKLFLAPLLLAVFYIEVMGQNDFVVRITILEAAMATMITAAVIAGEFSLDEELANLMVGVGIPLSLVTVALWNYCLGFWLV